MHKPNQNLSIATARVPLSAVQADFSMDHIQLRIPKSTQDFSWKGAPFEGCIQMYPVGLQSYQMWEPFLACVVLLIYSLLLLRLARTWTF